MKDISVPKLVFKIVRLAKDLVLPSVLSVEHPCTRLHLHPREPGDLQAVVLSAGSLASKQIRSVYAVAEDYP